LRILARLLADRFALPAADPTNDSLSADKLVVRVAAGYGNARTAFGGPITGSFGLIKHKIGQMAILASSESIVSPGPRA
jgi:hypothetical protein